MKFDSINLIGFKSFADRVALSFEDGITGVVGPNGCGKSNLFDALSWVLGAQNARDMRGLKMEDFIFGGTRKRKQSGLAQVALEISLDTPVSLDLQGETVEEEHLEICRKLYRSGESVYLVNGRRCRLKDIHSILESLGLDYASYALIAQGKIDAFLTASPLERRALIEEAARITGYKRRRRRAEHKLELAQQNLVRANDIISEVERALRTLKRQAARARQYKRLRGEFRDLQAQRFALEAHTYQEDLGRHRNRFEELTQLFSDLEREIQVATAEYKRRAEERNRLESQLASLSEESSTLLLEVDRTQNTIGHTEQQIEVTLKHLVQLESEKTALRQSLQRVQAEKERFQQEIGGISAQLGKNEGVLEKYSILVEQSAERVVQAESSIEAERSRVLELSAQKASLARLEEQLQAQLQELRTREQRLVEDQARVQRDLEHWDRELTSNSTQLRELESNRSELQDRYSRGQEAVRTLHGIVTELQEEQQAHNTRLIGLRERLHSLQEIELSRSQYSDGVRKILKSLTDRKVVETNGTLADQMETSPEYEQLVEGFLHDKLEYVLVDSMTEARSGFTEALAMRGGSCSFLTLRSENGFGKEPRPSLPVAGERGVVGTLSQLIKMAPAVEGAFQRVLPESANAIVCSTLEDAFRLSHSYPSSTFVTLDGAALSPRGLLTANVAAGQEMGLLAIKRKRRDLEKRICEAERQHKNIEEKLAAATQQWEAEGQRASSHREAQEQSERSIWQLKLKEEQIESNLNREKERQQQVVADLEGVRSEIELVLRQQDQAEEDLARATSGRMEAEKRLVTLGGQLSQLRSESESTRQQYNSLSSDRKVIQERRQALQETFSRIEEQEKAQLEREAMVDSSATQGNERIQQMSSQIEELSSTLETLKSREGEVALELEERRSDYERWKSEAPDVDERLEDLRRRRDTAQQSRGDLQVEVARIETQLEGIEEKCREQLQLSLHSILENVDLGDADSEQIVARHAELKTKLDSFGPVNMTALDEYQENEQRHQFLITQRADLEQSIADTQRAIRDLNRRSRERFTEAFEAVNRNFKEVFQTLFDGGDCGIRLLDEDDVLESGLEIYAQPPGKRLQSVSLLSGGEKALTVFALLVGLFTYRPSQFCILDEVDAPLDDANVRRFVKLLRMMSEKTQIIVITHNKQTMEAADALFGVTMQEPGVSEVVSVRI